MNNNYLTYICCPKCKGELILKDSLLICINCNTTYEIKEGIPILINKNTLNKHLIGQIKYFENEMDDVFNNYKLEAWQESYVKRFMDNFSNVKNALILDCGVGSGYMAIELAKRGSNVVACDLTLKNLIKLKNIASSQNMLDNITFICCSAEELPFKKNIFNYYISNAVLEHLPREKEAIEEINRVCKNISGVMIVVPLLYNYINPLFLPLNIIHDIRIGHLRRYSEDILINKFHRFTLVKKYYTGHSKKVFKVLCNILLRKNVFNDYEIEKEDEKKQDNKLFASNIICFFKRVESKANHD